MVRLIQWTIGLMITSEFTVFANSLSSIRYAYNNDDGNRHMDSMELNSTMTTIHGSNETKHLHSISNGRLVPHCLQSSIGDFPQDFMSHKQRAEGGVIVHVLIAMYTCYGLAILCDKFFVPSLELLSDRLGLTSDVAGATLMAAGTSLPELFQSIIGAFITEGDIGLGTIVGSAVFNILAVTSVCGILTSMVVPLDWWPLTRDCAFYVVTVVALVFIIRDEKVYWYESTVLLLMFVLYVIMMHFNPTLSKFFKARASAFHFCSDKQMEGDAPIGDSHSVQALPSAPPLTATSGNAEHGHIIVIDNTLLVSDSTKPDAAVTTTMAIKDHQDGKLPPVHNHENLEEEVDVGIDALPDDEWSPLTIPAGNHFSKAVYIATWPLNMLFFCTIPNLSRPKWKSFYLLTFVISVLYIGFLSYLVAWMVTILGYTIGIPDTVMGITFLAIGTSIPEGCSSVIVCRKGFGNMAISNSVGSNVFDILFCLGLPWLIKAVAFSSSKGYVQINSSGIVYSALWILGLVIILYAVIAMCRFQLNLKVGIICLIMYIAFMLFASLIELNFFGKVNPPVCPV